ncbi:chemotaxis protein CheB [uncultured Aureimonas sp.]|uniref:chemotaxis protein CheB n=1 Tax=uncultured Aureimonas sp. TaxID=1604662 RepID=UPI0025F31076|nr:chemotaxis protein CheB [uncultured Aureimonas sp.]
MTRTVLVATADAFLRLALETTLRANGSAGTPAHVGDPADLPRRAAAPGTLVILGGDLIGRVDPETLPRGRVLVVDAGPGRLSVGNLPVLAARHEGGLDVSRLRAGLVAALEALPGARGKRAETTVIDRPAEATPSARAGVLVFGASTGGPAPLIEILSMLGRPSIPVLVAIHMPADQTAGFAAHLSRTTRLDVVEAGEGPVPVPEAGTVTVLRGGTHFELGHRLGTPMLRASAAAPGPYRPSIDLLLSSAARSGIACDAVILSGMGADGARGAAEIERAGGRVFVQRSDTCVVAGMPEAARGACRSARVVDPASLASLLRHSAAAAALARSAP